MKTDIKLLPWMPRIICIAAILFLSLFAFDSFDPALTAWQQALALVIHLLPSLVLLALLVFTWRHELAGGLVFTLVALAFVPFIYSHNYRMNHSVLMSVSIVMAINMPFVIAGVLFIVSHFRKRSRNKGQE